MKHDPVNHPRHYTQGRIEVIEYIEDQGMGYHAGNIIKYVSRYRYKNGVQDLKKARWYLDRLIQLEEAGKDDTVDIPERKVTVYQVKDRSEEFKLDKSKPLSPDNCRNRGSICYSCGYKYKCYDLDVVS